MEYIWLTDIHLNFLTKEKRLEFYKAITDVSCEGIFITGDVAEAPSVSEILIEMSEVIKKPIYFVLGNHDYYHSEVKKVREEMKKITKKNSLLNWLPAVRSHDLGNNTILVGQDCWADGRYGDYINSKVSLNDEKMIHDLFKNSISGKYSLLDAMRKLADKDAKMLKNNLLESIKNTQLNKIIVLTHIPPFKESCLYEGKITNDDYLPFFSSKVTGDVLLEIANKNRDIKILVLCGHTHNEAYFKPCDNLIVKTGNAEYMHPAIQEIIAIKCKSKF